MSPLLNHTGGETELTVVHLVASPVLLKVEEFDDIKSGYRVKFHFDENPFFDNDTLVKEFHLSTSGESISQARSTTLLMGSLLKVIRRPLLLK